MTLFQYQPKAEPLVFDSAETVTVDKWFQGPPNPTLKKPQTQTGYSVGPLVTSFGEVIFVDKWFQPASARLSPARRNPEGIFASPLEPSLITEPPLDSWLRPTQTPTPPPRRGPEGLSVIPWEPTQLILPSLDSWVQPTERPPAKARSIQQSEWFVIPWQPFQVAEQFSPGIHNGFSPPRPISTWTYQGLAAPLEPSLFTEPALESWHRPTETPPDKARRNPEGISAFTFEPSLFVTPATMSWLRETNKPLFDVLRGPEGWLATVAAWTPDTLTLDKWWRPASEPLLPPKGIRPEQYVSTLEPSLFETPATMSWLREQNQPLFAALRNPEGWSADLGAWTPGTLTVDKWWQPASAPLHLAKSIQPEQYVSTLDPSLITEPALESWHRPTEVPPDKARRNPEGISAYDFEPSLFTEPPLDSWLRPTATPPAGKPQSAQVGWSTSLTTIGTVTQTVDSWFVQGVMPVIRQAQTPWQFGLPFVEVNTLDKWFQPTQIPTPPARRGPEGIFSSPWEPTQLLVPPLDWYRQTEKPPDKARRNPEGVSVYDFEPSLFTEPALGSWHRPTETPPSKARRSPEGLFLYSFEPSLFTTQALDWFVLSAIPVVSARRQQSEGVKPVEFTATVTDISWYAPQSVPAPRQRLNQQAVISILNADLFIEGVAWQQPQSVPVRTKPLRLGWITDSTALPTAPTTLDQWGQPASIPVTAHKKAPQGGTFFVSLVAETLDKWFVQHQIPAQKPRKPLGWFDLPFPEAITVDKWLGQQSVPVALKRPLVQNPTVQPFFFLDVAAALSWAFQPPMTQTVKPRQFPLPYFVQYDQARILDWFVQFPTAPPPPKVRDGKFILDPFPLPNVVNLDMWWVESFNPVLRKPSAGHLLILPFTPIIITITPPCPYVPLAGDQADFYSFSVDQGDDSPDLRADEGDVYFGRQDQADDEVKRPEDDDRNFDKRDECV